MFNDQDGSVIYCHRPDQERIASDVIGQLSRDLTWEDPIPIEIAPLAVAPRIARLRREYAARLK